MSTHAPLFARPRTDRDAILAQRDALFDALAGLVDTLDPLTLTVAQCRALDAAVVALGAAEGK